MIVNWDDKLSVNVKEMDDHHRQLVNQINELHDAMRVGKGKEKLVQIISKLIDYCDFHFTSEEKHMEKCNYHGLAQQKIEHRKFTEQIKTFQKELSEGKLSLSMEVMNFLKDWLINHINVVDKKYGPCFNEHGLK